MSQKVKTFYSHPIIRWMTRVIHKRALRGSFYIIIKNLNYYRYSIIAIAVYFLTYA